MFDFGGGGEEENMFSSGGGGFPFGSSSGMGGNPGFSFKVFRK